MSHSRLINKPHELLQLYYVKIDFEIGHRTKFAHSIGKPFWKWAKCYATATTTQSTEHIEIVTIITNIIWLQLVLDWTICDVFEKIVKGLLKMNFAFSLIYIKQLARIGVFLFACERVCLSAEYERTHWNRFLATDTYAQAPQPSKLSTIMISLHSN